MAFLSPWFLAGGLAVAVPIVLHLLRREPERRVRFSAVHLLRRAPVEHASRRRLRELVLLALRVAALLLLALAFARPFLGSNLGTAGATTVVVLDTSLSMSAPGQFEKARALAKDAVRKAGAAGLVAVVTFADGAQAASQPSADRASAVAAIDQARPGAGGTRFRAGVNAAVDLLRGRPGHLVVVTDLQETGWDAGDRVSVPDSVSVEAVDVGAPPPNLAMTSARLLGDRIVATVRNAGPEPVSALVRLSAPETPGGSAPARSVHETSVPVGAGQSATVTFDAPKAQWASISVDDATGAAADNARFLVLDSAATSTVLVITTSGDLSRDAFYLEQALAAAGADGRSSGVEGASTTEVSSWEQARLDRHTAVVLLSTRALEHHARQLLTAYVQHGGGLIVGGGPEVDGDVLQEVLAGPRVALLAADAAAPPPKVARTWSPTDVRHPLVRAFGTARGALGMVTFPRIATLRSEDCPVLARFTTGEPALVDCASGDGHALILASDLDNRGNDFPLHATFVPFLHESLKYLTAGQHRAADYLVSDVPAGVAAAPGMANLPGGDGASLVAVNVDPAESDPGRLRPDEFVAAVTPLGGGAQAGARLQAQEQEERQHIWQYVLTLLLAVMLIESWVATRIA